MALHRPSIRQDVRREVENRALKNEEGKFLDANTHKPIDGNYDLGHVAGHEYRDELLKAEADGLTQKEFNDRMNNPDLYQIEDPHENRSHAHEDQGENGFKSDTRPQSLHRPYIRNDVRREVEARALKNEKGQFLDANTLEPINGKYDLGHITNHEYKTELAKAEAEGLTQDEFNDRMNNPDLYQIESPESNRSHVYEAGNTNPRPSRVERMYNEQGKDDYPGHDVAQNGIIAHGSNDRIYCSEWFEGQKGSGFFTDKATVDSCVHDGVLNSNELAGKLQTRPSDYYESENGGLWDQKPIVSAYRIDWDALDGLKTSNPSLYNQLTNPGNVNPDNDGLSCAYGKVAANPQYGEGGGNQYYIDKPAFMQAQELGVFEKDESMSYSEAAGNLEREKVAFDQQANDDQIAKIATAEAQKGTPTPEELNSKEVAVDPDQAYITNPDYSYNYSEDNDLADEDMDNPKPEDEEHEESSSEKTEDVPTEENAEEIPNIALNTAEEAPTEDAEEMPTEGMQDGPVETDGESDGMATTAGEAVDEDGMDAGMDDEMPVENNEAPGFDVPDTSSGPTNENAETSMPSTANGEEPSEDGETEGGGMSDGYNGIE